MKRIRTVAEVWHNNMTVVIEVPVEILGNKAIDNAIFKSSRKEVFNGHYPERILVRQVTLYAVKQ